MHETDDSTTRRRAAAWENPRNWSLYGTVYNAPEDDRVLVPKRRAYLGWTLNFARPEAYFGLALSAAALAGVYAYRQRAFRGK